MATRVLRNRRGFTIIETVIASGILALVLVGLVALLGASFRIWSGGASGTSANSYAAIAVRRLVLDIEPGSGASVNGSGQLVVTFPYRDTTTGDYDRSKVGSTATYYLSGTSGGETSGTYLWRSISGTKTQLAQNVQSLTFSVTNSRLVRINLTGYDSEGTAISPNLIQVSAKLRNN